MITGEDKRRPRNAKEIAMRLRKLSIPAFAFVIGSVAMADAAMAARPKRDKAWDVIPFDYFQELCGDMGGESIGSLDAGNNGDVVCFLPDGRTIRCDVVNGETRNCTSTKLEPPSGGYFVPAQVYDGANSFTSRTSTGSITSSTSSRQTLTGFTASRA
jgi:hypothetical protein